MAESLDELLTHDPQLLDYYQCERCAHVFNWRRTQWLPSGRAKDGSRVCPRCATGFVRKFRQSDLDAMMATFPDGCRPVPAR